MGKQIGNGSVLAAQFSTTGSTTFSTVANIINIGGPASAGNDVDTTTLTTTDNFQTFQRGDVDPGEVTCSLALSSTTSIKQLGTAHNDGLARTWKVTPPTTADAETFSAYVKGMDRTIDRNTMIVRALTLKVTGSPGIAST